MRPRGLVILLLAVAAAIPKPRRSTEESRALLRRPVWNADQLFLRPSGALQRTSR